MRTHLKIDNLSPQEKEIFTAYFEQKMLRLQKIVDPYNYDEDAVKISLSIVHAEKHNTYLTTIQVDIPHMKFHHDEAKHNMHEVLDLVFDNISKQMRDYFKKRKSNHKSGTPAEEIEEIKEEYETL